MRYQERIYIQNDNRAVRNKDMLNVNMSSDLSIFQQPKFTLSGGTKVHCDSIILTADTSNFQNFVLDTYASCFGLTAINPHCYGETDFIADIYINNDIVYSGSIYTDYVFSGIPTDTEVGTGLATIFTNLGYLFTHTGTTFEISKPYGAHELRVDLSISFNLDGLGACPSGYSGNSFQDGCIKIDSTAYDFLGNGPVIVSGDTFSGYTSLGTYFYPEISTLGPYPLKYSGGLLTNGDNTTINPVFISNSVQNNSFWYNSGNTSNGRLNNVAISAITDSADTQYVGFSYCLDTASGGTYYVGIAADNLCKLYLNSELLVFFSSITTTNFTTWSVFPITFKSGKNIIEVLGNNQAAKSAFGVEIYNPITFNRLTGATSTISEQANVIFSTKDKIGYYFQITEGLVPFGYSCPSGYALDTCGSYQCSQILRSDYTLPCGGNCSGSASTIADGWFPYIDNTSQGVYIVDGGNSTSSIPVTFNFTANTNTFTANSATFNYKVYKYNADIGLFTVPPVYESQDFSYSTFTNTNELSTLIPLSGLSLDGDYLIKGYFKSVVGTDFLSRLGKVLDTYQYNKGSKYQLYDSNLDSYFVAITKADTPLFTQSQVSGNSIGTNNVLYQQIILVDSTKGNLANGFTRTGSTFTLANQYVGDILVTLNGLVLAKDIDYTINSQILTFTGDVFVGDIISIIYTRSSTSTITSNTIIVSTTIPSGPTNGEGTNQYYYNTTTGKYEIYTTNNPVTGSNIIITLNGITLAYNVDYYQSTSKPNRIILEGIIMVNDIITIVYTPQANIVNGITQNNNVINWYITNQQNSVNGTFEIQYSSGSTFSTHIISDTVSYAPYVTSYSGILSLSGSAGTAWYYRVKNKKEYPSICGDLIESVAYSEVIPVIIQSNAINSY